MGTVDVDLVARLPDAAEQRGQRDVVADDVGCRPRRLAADVIHGINDGDRGLQVDIAAGRFDLIHIQVAIGLEESDVAGRDRVDRGVAHTVDFEVVTGLANVRIGQQINAGLSLQLGEVVVQGVDNRTVSLQEDAAGL